MSTQSFDPVNGTLSCEDWELIVETLRVYVGDQEDIISTENVGDKPYNLLARIHAIANDIDVFIIPMDRARQEHEVTA